MVQVSEPAIIVALITVIGAIITAIIGASKYGRRKAETSLFAEFRASSTAMQDSYKETIADLRSDKEIIKVEREVMHEERNKMREQRDIALAQRDKAIEELGNFKKDFDKMKDMVQANTTEIEIIKDLFCIDAKICNKRKSA